MPDYFLTAELFVGSVAQADAVADLRPVVAGFLDASVTPTTKAIVAFAAVTHTGTGTVNAQVTASYEPRLFASGEAKTVGTAVCYLDQLTAPIGGVITASGGADFGVEGSGMRLTRVATQVYNLWGIEVTTARDIDFARSRVTEIINAALQVMYSRAHVLDYFNRVSSTLEFAANVASAVLPLNMQTLLDPVREATTRTPLRKASDISEFEEYVDLYCNGTAPAVPRLYYAESLASSSDDSAHCVLRLTPAPAESFTVAFDYAAQAPRYRDSDILKNVTVPIPHAYAESILLPLVKHAAASDNLFRRQDMRQAIQADYQRAMVMLGLVSTQNPAVRESKTTPREAVSA